MKKTSTIFLQLVIVALAIGTFALLLWEPHLEGRNAHATLFAMYLSDPFLALVYLGSVPFFVALYQSFTALRYVRQHKVFSQAVVNALKTIRYCAIAIIGFIAVEEIFILLNHGNDDPAGGVFMGLVITFGSLVVAAAASMLEGIVKNAVERKS